MSGYSTGYATEADKAELVALGASVGEGFAGEHDFDHWFGVHPFGEVVVPIVRDGAGRIVGAAWIFPMRVRAGGRRIAMDNAANLHLHPDHRGGFAYPLLSRHLDRTLRERSPLHFSLVSAATSERHARSHPELVAKLPWLIRVLDAPAWARDYGRSGWRRLASPLVGAVATAVFGGPPQERDDPGTATGIGVVGDEETGPSEGRAVCAVTDFDHRFDELQETLGARDVVMPERSAAFLRWRFTGLRERRYCILIAPSERGIDGYVVLRTMDHRIREGHVVDLLVRDGPRGRTAGAALTRAAEEHFRDEEVVVASSAPPPGAAEAEVLRSAGFRANPLEDRGRLQGLWPAPLRAALFPHPSDPDDEAGALLDRGIGPWYLNLLHHEMI